MNLNSLQKFSSGKIETKFMDLNSGSGNRIGFVGKFLVQVEERERLMRKREKEKREDTLVRLDDTF